MLMESPGNTIGRRVQPSAYECLADGVAELEKALRQLESIPATKADATDLRRVLARIADLKRNAQRRMLATSSPSLAALKVLSR